MDKELLISVSSTAKVRLLALEFLSDGKVHRRKEIVDYIRTKERDYGLEHFSQGCIAGGIQQAVSSENCIKRGSAAYQLINGAQESHAAMQPASSSDMKNDGGFTERNCIADVVDLGENFMLQLTEISRSIDYVNADEKELEILSLLREYIQDIRRWTEKFSSFTEAE